MSNLRCAEAKSSDIPAIVEIHNSSVLERGAANPHGFLLTETNTVEISQNMSRSTQYFVALNTANEIAGYLALSQPTISQEFLDEINWSDRTCISKILSKRHFYIKTVAIQPSLMGQGIAQFLYQSIYEIFPDSYFSAFIVTKPIANERSVRFHEKQGFKQVGVFSGNQFLDLKDYQSVLFFKECSQKTGERSVF